MNKNTKTYWVERTAQSRKCVAEIYVSGGQFSYMEKTCVGRIFAKHLSPDELVKFLHSIENAVMAMNKSADSDDKTLK
jgi:hypothetical protein